MALSRPGSPSSFRSQLNCHLHIWSGTSMTRAGRVFRTQILRRPWRALRVSASLSTLPWAPPLPHLLHPSPSPAPRWGHPWPLALMKVPPTPPPPCPPSDYHTTWGTYIQLSPSLLFPHLLLSSLLCILRGRGRDMVYHLLHPHLKSLLLLASHGVLHTLGF